MGYFLGVGGYKTGITSLSSSTYSCGKLCYPIALI